MPPASAGQAAGQSPRWNVAPAVAAVGATHVSATRMTGSETSSETMNAKRLKRLPGLRVSWGVKAVVLGERLPDQ